MKKQKTSTISPTFRAGNLDQFADGDPAVSRLRDRAFRKIEGAMGKIVKYRDASRSDTTKTPNGAEADAHKKAVELFESIAPELDREREKFRDATEELRYQKILKPLAEKIDPEIGREIRSHLKGLTDEKRQKLINQWIKERDTESLSAVLTAKPYLSGLDDSQFRHLQGRFESELYPDVFEKIQKREKALDRYRRAERLLRSAIFDKGHDSFLFNRDLLATADQSAKRYPNMNN